MLASTLSFMTRFIVPNSTRLVRSMAFSHTGPGIGPERDCRQACAVIQGRRGVGLPGITGLLRVGNLGRGDDDRVTLDAGIGPVPLLILTSDRELFQLCALHHQAAVCMREVDFDRA